jgi:hypothetical protein
MAARGCAASRRNNNAPAPETRITLSADQLWMSARAASPLSDVQRASLAEWDCVKATGFPLSRE